MYYVLLCFAILLLFLLFLCVFVIYFIVVWYVLFLFSVFLLFLLCFDISVTFCYFWCVFIRSCFLNSICIMSCYALLFVAIVVRMFVTFVTFVMFLTHYAISVSCSCLLFFLTIWVCYGCCVLLAFDMLCYFSIFTNMCTYVLLCFV